MGFAIYERSTVCMAFYVTDEEPERALLVGVDLPGSPWNLDSSMEELARLTETAGAVVVDRTTQKLDKPNPRTFVGSGKAQEIADTCLALAIDVVIFDDELTPSQQSNLEHMVSKNIKIIDRTALILDIFALHATSKEGRLQVSLAQNEYLYPRLRGMWAHLASNRMGGGVGSRFGEGESQLEVDRRIIRNRITSIKRELKQVSARRDVQRKSRMESGVFKVALAGYTNAGKSSLMNALTGAEVLSYDKLFATLDSKSHKMELPDGREVTLTDTVGFIQKLPTKLIESFRSTLDEIKYADLVLHVADTSSPEMHDQIKTVNEILSQIVDSEIPRIQVYNKIDLLSEEERENLTLSDKDAVLISAQEGEGLDNLLARISEEAANHGSYMTVRIPYDRGDLVYVAHERCTLIEESYDDTGTVMRLHVSEPLKNTFARFSVE